MSQQSSEHYQHLKYQQWTAMLDRGEEEGPGSIEQQTFEDSTHQTTGSVSQGKSNVETKYVVMENKT